MMENDANTLQK
jgi:hypothetical protein